MMKICDGFKISLIIACTTLATITTYAQKISGISTDRAIYDPGSTVSFKLGIDVFSTGKSLNITYYHLNKVIKTQTIAVASNTVQWEWESPKYDFTGYLVDAQLLSSDQMLDQTTIAVDVSSNWSKFPRYGFLSKYGSISDTNIKGTMDNLNRHHINGIQFYDWHNKHHLPLPGAPDEPKSSWKDIGNNDVQLETVKKYIESAHDHGMKAMAYNLAFGAWSDAANDGVKPQWYIYKDVNHATKDFHDLPDSWQSDLFLLDPGNRSWQQYIIDRTNEAFEVLNFDGFHIDQLGNRGTIYNYNGESVSLEKRYLSFLNYTDDHLNGEFVFNAVDQYGQSNLAKGDVEFLYTETWSSQTYDDLYKVIQENYSLGQGQLGIVMAAYMNYDRADKGTGYFNTNSVTMTDAVIFASGGSHLELGEHMLGREYFPNSNLSMNQALKNNMVAYYDFLVAYENLLRDGGKFGMKPITSLNANVKISAWPAVLGKVAYINKRVASKEVFHLINLDGANSLSWRDNTATQSKPKIHLDTELSFPTTSIVKSLWMASPDTLDGAPITLDFTQDQSGKITTTLPYLSYWTMLVADYEGGLGFTPSTINHQESLGVQIYFEQFYSEGSTIYYTFDQNLPMDNPALWTKYDAPISIAQNVTIRAFYIDNLGSSSMVYKQSYNFDQIELSVIKPDYWGQVNMHITGVTPTGSIAMTVWPGTVLTSSHQNDGMFNISIPSGAQSIDVIFSDNGNHPIDRMTISDSQIIDLNQYVLSIENKNDGKSSISIYPNPFEDQINIWFRDLNQINRSEIRLFNQLGQEMKNITILSNENQMSISNLDMPHGYYYLMASSKEGVEYFKLLH